MRRYLPLLFALVAFSAFAQQPPQLEPVPEPPPSATPLDERALSERGVQIRPGETAEEFMVEGKRVIRVHQSNGNVYYLIEAMAGYSGPAGTDSSDSRLRVPQWVIREW